MLADGIQRQVRAGEMELRAEELLYVVRMLLVGAMTVCYLKRALSGVHWASLVLLVNAVASSQLATCTDCHTWGDYHSARGSSRSCRAPSRPSRACTSRSA